MKAIYKELLDNSVAASLSAIEIYNKPDFKYRNQIFVILLVNAWELLLKAQIIKENKLKVKAIYKYSDGKIVKNRTNTPMTIDLGTCIKKLSLNETVADNIDALVIIRDSSIHFYNKEQVNYIAYSLGAASLRNYNKLCKLWFNKDLLQYNFYILPLGFDYNFKTFSLIDLDKFPEALRNIIQDLSLKQSEDRDREYQFTCEIETKLISAKKIVEDEAATIKIDNTLDGKTGAFVYKTQNLTDKYPLSWNELRDNVKTLLPTFNQTYFVKKMKELQVKEDTRYSSYVFRNKQDELEYKNTSKVKKGTTSIYNYECVMYLVTKIKE